MVRHTERFCCRVELYEHYFRAAVDKQLNANCFFLISFSNIARLSPNAVRCAMYSAMECVWHQSVDRERYLETTHSPTALGSFSSQFSHIAGWMRTFSNRMHMGTTPLAAAATRKIARMTPLQNVFVGIRTAIEKDRSDTAIHSASRRRKRLRCLMTAPRVRNRAKESARASAAIHLRSMNDIVLIWSRMFNIVLF